MYSIDYQYLRPKKAEALKAWYDEPLAIMENPAVWRGKNATILPLRRQAEDNLLFGRGGVVDENGEYVPLSGIEGRVQFAYPAEKKEYRDETVVYCGYLVNHWGHFLIEGVTRLWYFLENDPGVDKYVFFLDENEEREIRANYREFLELLGIWEHLEIINTPTTYREVIVPELGLYCRRSTTRWRTMRRQTPIGSARRKSTIAVANSRRECPLNPALTRWTIFSGETATPFSIRKKCRSAG